MNHDERPSGAVIDTLVLHYTGTPTAAKARELLCGPDAKVSAHYLVDEDGTVSALVDERRRAWHAGVSFWRGRTGLNANSIGIEIVNPGHDFGYRRFPEAQMTALVGLCRDIVRRRPVPACNVVGHSDIAPRRKLDPGELFDWPRLSAAGIGLWTASGPPATPDKARALDLLSAIGYETGDLAATIAAFQRRFRPGRIDGVVDAETMGRLEAAAALYRANA